MNVPRPTWPGNQPAPRRLGVGARDGGDGDAEVIRQVAVRRQVRAGAQRALLHVLVDGVGDGAVLGPRRPSRSGSHIVMAAIMELNLPQCNVV